MRIISGLLFLMLLFCKSSILAQNPLYKSSVPVSPQSANLIKVIEYPVDYTRGLMDISIPLYTVKVNDIQIPIVLKYHGSGNKVHDMSGWVGLGWSLQAEPTVTRTINGMADENSFLGNSSLGNTTKPFLDQAATGINDELPDEFYYSLTDKQGAFFFSRKPNVSGYTIKTQPFEPLLISKISPTVLTQIYGFNITDDSGRQYVFGQDKLGNNLSERTDMLDVVTWKGSMIISANKKDTVFFSYSPAYQERIISPPSQSITIEDKSSYQLLSEMVGPLLDCGTNIVWPLTEQLPKPVITKYANSFQNQYLYNPSTQQLQLYRGPLDAQMPAISSYMSTLYTQEIDFRGGKVIFSIGLRTKVPGGQISDNSYCLNKITVYNAFNQKIKEITFNYSEFVSTNNVPNGGNPLLESRLRLVSLQISNDNSLPFNYSFDYNNTQLPNHFSYDVDLWGFYNGPKNNKSLIPPTTISTSVTQGTDFNLTLGDADRTSDENYMQAGVLTKITYPTGGSTTFGYEANRAYNYQTNTNTIVGGLRILYVNNYDPISNVTNYRSFKYGVNENGGGVTRHWLTGALYNPYIIQQNKYARLNFLAPFHCADQTLAYQYQTTPGIYTSRFRTIMSNPVADIFYKGAVVSYQQVTEYNGALNDSQYQGKTVHKSLFAGMGSGGGYETPYFINGTTLPYDNKIDWTYGVPQETTQMKNDGANRSVRSDFPYYNAYFQPETIWSRSVFKSTFSIGDFAAYPDLQSNQTFQTQVNEYQTGYNQLIADTLKDYAIDGVSVITSIKNFLYGNPSVTYPTQTSFINSGGQTNLTKTYYVQDIVAQGQTEPYQKMIDNNMLAQPIAIENYVNGTLQTKVTTAYSRYWPSNSSLIVPQSVKIINKTLPEETRVVMSSYDDKGNVLGVSKDGKPESYIWGYQQYYPIAQATNATVNDIFYDGFEEGNGNSTDSQTGHYSHNGPYSKALTGLDAGSYTLTYWQKSAGVWALITTSVQVTGSTYTIGGSASPINAQIDDVRFYPSTASMTTFTYDPLIGMTTTTDAKGIITYYEYDGSQRLINIRDKDKNIVKHYDYHYAGQ